MWTYKPNYMEKQQFLIVSSPLQKNDVSFASKKTAAEFLGEMAARRLMMALAAVPWDFWGGFFWGFTLW